MSVDRPGVAGDVEESGPLAVGLDPAVGEESAATEVAEEIEAETSSSPVARSQIVSATAVLIAEQEVAGRVEVWRARRSCRASQRAGDLPRCGIDDHRLTVAELGGDPPAVPRRR